MFQQKDKSPESSDAGEFRSRAEIDSAPARGKSKTSDNSRKDKPDPMLPEKKRARRRLIGAVALVIAAVIGLPMLLDPEPKPLADDIAIQIPSKDKSSATSALPEPVQSGKNAAVEPEEIIEPPAVSVVAEKVPVKASVAQSDVKTEVNNSAKPELKTNNKSENKADNKSATVTPDTKKASTLAPVIKSDAISAGSVSSASDDTRRALAILDGKPQLKVSEKDAVKLDKSAAVEKAHSNYLVQVAALSTPEKIHELQDKLKAAGIKSYTQKIVTASGEVSRIRVGPFSTKSEAEKAHAALVKAGLGGTIIPN